MALRGAIGQQGHLICSKPGVPIYAVVDASDNDGACTLTGITAAGLTVTF